MKMILFFFCCLSIVIEVARADGSCPLPNQIATALKYAGRQMPGLLKSDAQINIEDGYIPENIALQGNMVTDSSGNRFCSYYVAGGSADAPLFIIKIGKEEKAETKEAEIKKRK